MDGNEDIIRWQAMPRHGAHSARKESRDAREKDKNSNQERQTQRQRGNKMGEGEAEKMYMQFVPL